ncbi:MAG: ParB/RepB/Spo0J family partition protein [Gammaproteobacteria bacterium]|nr:MAG: ParB/RepB/Spo0J family partition protein [Gammaproteobacteria bacterium]
MATKKRGLGRGLDSLLGAAAKTDEDGKIFLNGELKEIPVELLQRGKYQPRIDIRQETLQELANSIKEQGIVQPISVRPIGKNSYEIIAGERRWRAAQLAGLETVSAVVRDVPDSTAIAMALIENIQRENLNPLEEAIALKRLIDEFDMTHQQAADAVGRSRAAVSNLLRLLELHSFVKDLIEQRKLEMGHARALLALKKEQQKQAAKVVSEKEYSVRETEKYVKKLLEGAEKGGEKKQKRDPDIEHLQNNLSTRLGAKVALKHGIKGNGKLVIHYNDLDELDGIIAHIK